MAALALKDGVLADPHLDVQISGRAAVAARLSLAIQADAVPGIDTGGQRDGQALLLAHAALAKAGIAGIADDLASALASRAGLLDREYGLLHAHLSLAVTGIAGLRGGPLGASRALAGLALRQRGNLYLGFSAEHRLLEIELEFVAQIGAAKHLGAAALAAGENVAEHLAENVAECLAGTEAPTAASFETGVPELVVDGALLRVAEDFVGLLRFLEFMFRVRIVWIAVRMIFHGEPAVGLLDIDLGRVSR